MALGGQHVADAAGGLSRPPTVVVGTVFSWEPEEASEWFLSHPNQERAEQEDNLLWRLEEAKSPQEAAAAAVEAAYDLMVAKSHQPE